ncbi:MAG: acyltransferase 3 [Frankiales bacterium]|nr:acyltransferase 3 [Frankiales bacterium]
MTAPSFESYQARSRFKALDGVRALAVLLVVTWHVRSGALSGVNGDFGVSIFFILSGFLITTLAIREEHRTGRFSYAAFMIRRVFRIWPLLWLGILVYAVAIYGLHLDNRGVAFARAVPYYIFYFPEYPLFSHPPVLAHADGPVPFSGVWSIGIEEKFYLIWPLLAFGLLKARRGRGWLALAMAVGFYLVQAFGTYTAAKYLYAYAPIAVGSALALMLDTVPGYTFFQRFFPRWLGVLALMGSIALNAFRPGVFVNAFHELLVAALIGAVVVRPDTVGARLLSGRVLARIGALSYGLYLFHVLGLKVAAKVLPTGNGIGLTLAEMALGLALAYLGCEIAHRLVELPAQRLGRRLAASLPARRANAVNGEVSVVLPSTTS